MRKLNLFLMAFAVLALFSSCKDRVSLDVEWEKPVPDDLIGFSLTPSFTDVSTRAYPSTIEEIRQARINFEGVRMIFYSLDENSKPTTIAYQFDFDINGKKGVLSGSDLKSVESNNSAFTIKTPMTIKRGNYHVYVIAGANESIKKATVADKDFSLITSAMSRDEVEFASEGYLKNSIYINTNPIVISEKELEAISDTQYYTLSKCPIAPINAFASVDWEPVIKDTNYVISNNKLMVFTDVLNKKFILLPEYESAVQEELGVNYPKDANFSGFGEKSLQELSEDFMYMPVKNSSGKEIYTSYASTKDDKVNNFLIIPENTMDANDYFGTVVTRLIIMATIYPANMNLEGVDIHNVTKISELPSWILYNGKGYTEAEFDSLYKECNAADPKTSEQVNLIIAYKELKNNETSYPVNSFHSKNVRYYKHGRSFFSIPLQHFKKEQLKGNNTLPGLYGVVRNTHYKINIKAFQSIGVASMKALEREINYKDMLNAHSGDILIEDTNVIERDIDVLY